MFATLSFIVALFGAGLGIYNAWKAHDRDQVKLQVDAGISFHPEDGVRLTVIVSNIGGVPVTVTGIGFDLHGPGPLVESLPLFGEQGYNLPHRLEARSEMRAASYPMHEIKFDPDRLKLPFAEIPGGKRFIGAKVEDIIRALKQAMAADSKRS